MTKESMSLQPALRENVIVEMESLEDYKKKTYEDKVKNWKEKPFMESLFSKPLRLPEMNLGDG